jgi:cytidylate kinase
LTGAEGSLAAKVPAAMIIAIDGPAGAGKSTVARMLADALGYRFLDSGAMYRAAALVDDAGADINLRNGRVFIGDRDVSDEIRTQAISEAASMLATDPDKRTKIIARQRALAAHGDWVIEGRDAASAIAPSADLKVFLTASVEERARRRAAQTGEALDAVTKEINERDVRDDTLGRSVLRPANGAVTVDTTGLTLDEVIAEIRSLLP